MLDGKLNNDKLISKILFADYDRLQKANNRFILQSESKLLPDGKHINTKFFVLDDYSFEPFAKCIFNGFYSDFPIPGIGVVRVPDGLGHYLTLTIPPLAKNFNHKSEWIDIWDFKKLGSK